MKPIKFDTASPFVTKAKGKRTLDTSFDFGFNVVSKKPKGGGS